MSDTVPTLHLLCGKIASGKSTLAAQLASGPGTVLISEDAWLSALFAEHMHTGADYLRYSGRLQRVIGPHVGAVLRAGVSVVLDFAANTVAQRRWMLQIVQETGAAHQMHVLDPPDAVCLDRLRARNAEGGHAFAATEEQYHRFARHFVVPTEDEGFNLVRH